MWQLRGVSRLISGRRVLLIDDVITTGATASVACQELLNSGAAAVSLCALARASRWEEHRQELYRRL